MAVKDVPFTVRLIAVPQSASNPPSPNPLTANLPNEPFADFLPAITRPDEHTIQAPSHGKGLLEVLGRELLVEKLNMMHDFLWLAGPSEPPENIGHHLVEAYEIVVTENVLLHLVQKASRIFIKPLPKYLLDEDFWKQHLVTATHNQSDPAVEAQRKEIRLCAKGLLLSYCAMVSYESDLKVAKNLGLLPADIEWARWRSWVAEVISNCPNDEINKRFRYGELRLDRLNTIYRCMKRPTLAPPILGPRWCNLVGAPRSFWETMMDDFALLALVLGFVVVFLTAMQVGLATDSLKATMGFQSFCVVFAVLSMIWTLQSMIFIVWRTVIRGWFDAWHRFKASRQHARTTGTP